MKRNKSLSLLLLCAAPLFAQGPLLEPEIVPTFERAQDGTDAKMDFTVPLKTPDGQKAIFGTWSGKPLLIFYFMPTCATASTPIRSWRRWRRTTRTSG